MANEKNLKPVRTKTEARERGRNGGIASGKARKENKLIKDRILERMGESDWETMIDNLIARAQEDTKSFETLRDTIGQKPKDELNVDTTVSINVELDDEY